MATVSDYKASATLYKRRKGAGKMPLHSDVSVTLPAHHVSQPTTPPNALKLSSATLGGRMVGKQFVVMVVGHYSNGIATKSVEKRYSDDMPVVDELPAFVLP